MSQSHDASLGSLIGGTRNIRHKARDGRNKDQMTRLLCAHIRKDGSSGVEGAVKVDSNQLIPEFRRQLVQIAVRSVGAAGVYEHLCRAPCFPGELRQLL